MITQDATLGLSCIAETDKDAMDELSMIEEYDVLVIGGGINGCGIAADAASRNLSVILCEKKDLSNATSSASTKLIHGGLRYLEQFNLQLVRKSLNERQTLQAIAPHLISPLEFVIPLLPNASRSPWFLRLGLFLYDHLSNKNTLPKTKWLTKNSNNLYFSNLQNSINSALSYFDCATDDARLTITNAIQARYFGANIQKHTEFISAQKTDGRWLATLKKSNNQEIKIFTKAIINASGPWVNKIDHLLDVESPYHITLVQGSHIIMPKLYQGNFAYMLQHTDKRIVFVIPYHGYSMIGTTDSHFEGDINNIKITSSEIKYLIEIINNYFKTRFSEKDIIHSWSGVRPLIAEKKKSLKHISRDYKLYLTNGSAPILSIYGGKITTYRQLAQEAVDMLSSVFPNLPPSKTAKTPLPSWYLENTDFVAYCKQAKQKYHWLPDRLLNRYLSSYACLTDLILKNCHTISHLGENFNHGLFAQEVDYLVEHEWATSVEDILWRRTKLGLKFSGVECENLKKYLKNTHNL